MAVFYVSYYRLLNINLVIKAVLVLLFSAAAIQVAGLWKAKRMLRRSKTVIEPVTPENPESIPQVTDENPEL
jgi:hypothetical protein